MIFRGVCAAVVLAALTGCSSAPPPNTAPTVGLPATHQLPAPPPAAPAAPRVDRDQAVHLAEQAAPGFKVTAIDLDTDDGRRTWDVHLTNAQGQRRDVDIDAETGQILPDLDND